MVPCHLMLIPHIDAEFDQRTSANHLISTTPRDHWNPYDRRSPAHGQRHSPSPGMGDRDFWRPLWNNQVSCKRCSCIQHLSRCSQPNSAQPCNIFNQSTPIKLWCIVMSCPTYGFVPITWKIVYIYIYTININIYIYNPSSLRGGHVDERGWTWTE